MATRQALVAAGRRAARRERHRPPNRCLCTAAGKSECLSCCAGNKLVEPVPADVGAGRRTPGATRRIRVRRDRSENLGAARTRFMGAWLWSVRAKGMQRPRRQYRSVSRNDPRRRLTGRSAQRPPKNGEGRAVHDGRLNQNSCSSVGHFSYPNLRVDGSTARPSSPLAGRPLAKLLSR
jgi:hypothetical protein